MAFRVVRETPETESGFRHIAEQCLFCGKQTRYWHEPTNNPVCVTCSNVHRVAELPDHGLVYRREMRKRRKEANTCSH